MSDTAIDGGKATPSMKATCSACAGDRHCGVRGTFVQKGGDEDFTWNKVWMILQCLGCDHVFAKTVASNSEDYNNYYEQDGSTGIECIETVEHWPALMKRKLPEWFEDLYFTGDDNNIYRSLKEVYGAMNSDLTVLSAIGMRTTFDVACEVLGIDPSLSFRAKLGELVAKGHIGVLDQERVSTLIESGGASIHRGWRPLADDLTTMMDTLEHFIFNAFVEPDRRRALDKKAAAIAARVPKRAKRLPSPAGAKPVKPVS